MIRPGVVMVHWAMSLPLLTATSFALYQIAPDSRRAGRGRAGPEAWLPDRRLSPAPSVRPLPPLLPAEAGDWPSAADRAPCAVRPSAAPPRQSTALPLQRLSPASPAGHLPAVRALRRRLRAAGGLRQAGGLHPPSRSPLPAFAAASAELGSAGEGRSLISAAGAISLGGSARRGRSETAWPPRVAPSRGPRICLQAAGIPTFPCAVLPLAQSATQLQNIKKVAHAGGRQHG